MTTMQVAERKDLYRRVRSLPTEKAFRVISFIRLIESEPSDDAIYEEMDPKEEDAMYKELASFSGVWDDE